MSNNYEKYRGRCKELSEKACKEDSTLRLVRGHYWCPVWNREEQHWWCEDSKGNIVDKSKLQFPSAGAGIYTEFNGVVTCEECGKDVKEEDMILMGRYPTCSDSCARRLVGL